MKKRFLVLVLMICSVFVFAFDYPELIDFLATDENEVYTPNLSGKEMIKYSLLFGRFWEDSDEYQEAMNRYEEFVSLLKDTDYSDKNDVQVAEDVLMKLYENILVRYVEIQNDMHETIMKGIYNCVTSNILYIACCKELGIDARAQKSPGHSFSTVYFGNDLKVDVETTNPFGFNPGEKKDLSAAKNMSSYAVVKPAKYKNRMEISDKSMAALIASNYCSYFVSKNDYVDAVPLGVTRYEFLKKEGTPESLKSRNDLDIICCNYGKDLQQKKLYKESLEWMNIFISKYEMTEYVQNCMDAFVYNSIVEKVNKRNTNAGYEIFEKEKNSVSENVQAEILDMLVESNWVEKISSAENEGDFFTALNLCRQAVSENPENKLFAQNLPRCEKNYAIMIHNQFADYVNAQDMVNAGKILEKGLKVVPGNKMLMTDYENLKSW